MAKEQKLSDTKRPDIAHPEDLPEEYLRMLSALKGSKYAALLLSLLEQYRYNRMVDIFFLSEKSDSLAIDKAWDRGRVAGITELKVAIEKAGEILDKKED